MRNLFAVFYVAYYEYFVLIHIIIAGIIFHACSFAPSRLHRTQCSVYSLRELSKPSRESGDWWDL